MTQGLALTPARYLDAEEVVPPPPSIRLIVTAALTKEDINKIISVLQDAFKHLTAS